MRSAAILFSLVLISSLAAFWYVQERGASERLARQNEKMGELEARLARAEHDRGLEISAAQRRVGSLRRELESAIAERDLIQQRLREEQGIARNADTLVPLQHDVIQQKQKVQDLATQLQQAKRSRSVEQSERQAARQSAQQQKREALAQIDSQIEAQQQANQQLQQQRATVRRRWDPVTWNTLTGQLAEGQTQLQSLREQRKAIARSDAGGAASDSGAWNRGAADRIADVEREYETEKAKLQEMEAQLHTATGDRDGGRAKIQQEESRLNQQNSRIAGIQAQLKAEEAHLESLKSKR